MTCPGGGGARGILGQGEFRGGEGHKKANAEGNRTVGLIGLTKANLGNTNRNDTQ